MQNLLHVDVPTTTPSSRYMVWGSDTAFQAVKALPNGKYLNAARLDMQPGRSKVNPSAPDNPPLVFTAHPSLLLALEAGWVPMFSENGVPYSFTPAEWVWHLPHHTCLEWTCLIPNGIVKLWTYLGNNDPTMFYEGRIYCEDLIHPEHAFKNMKMWCAGAGCVQGPGYLIQGLPANTTLHDAQGLAFDGQFLFYSDMTSQKELISLVSATAAMPVVVDQPISWGNIPKSTAFLKNASDGGIPANSINSYLGYKHSVDPFFFWPGVGNMKQGGSTGHQPGFGVWNHIDTLVSDAPTAYSYPDAIRAGQEALRPGHYFEPGTGSIVDPLERAPNFVTWDGVIHWHTGVGRDRLGRTHNSFQTESWTGQDRQHMTMKFLSEQVLLYGSQACAHELLHRSAIMLGNLTISRLHGKTSPNGALLGRAGRVWQALVDIYNATGDKRLITRVKEHLAEWEFPHWKKSVFGPFYITRVIANDFHTFGEGKQGWFVWEDAIMVQGLAQLADMLRKEGIGDYALTVEKQAANMARSVVLHGFTPDGAQIAKAVLFMDGQNRGIHTGIPLTAAQWESKDFAFPAVGTDYRYWALPCVEFARSYFFGDTAIQARCKQITSKMEPLSALSNQAHRRNFLGFGG